MSLITPPPMHNEWEKMNSMVMRLSVAMIIIKHDKNSDKTLLFLCQTLKVFRSLSCLFHCTEIQLKAHIMQVADKMYSINY